MRVLALDPGTAGGIAVLSETGVILVADLPVHQIGTAGKKTTRAELDLHTLHGLIAEHGPYAHAYIERVSSRPGEGVTGAFRFGYATGALTGLVVALGTPLTAVAPKEWQRWAGCGPAPDAARQRAAQLFPQIAPELARKRDAHRADALLIAAFGLHQCGGHEPRRTGAPR